MLEKAEPHAGNGVSFELGDIAAFAPGTPVDVVCSNAALHWVPDHPAVLARLHRTALRPGGQLGAGPGER